MIIGFFQTKICFGKFFINNWKTEPMKTIEKTTQKKMYNYNLIEA